MGGAWERHWTWRRRCPLKKHCLKGVSLERGAKGHGDEVNAIPVINVVAVMVAKSAAIGGVVGCSAGSHGV